MILWIGIEGIYQDNISQRMNVSDAHLSTATENHNFLYNKKKKPCIRPCRVSVKVRTYYIHFRMLQPWVHKSSAAYIGLQKADCTRSEDNPPEA